jgi:Fungal tRNA ligase phosphodiesterase domain
LVNLEIRLRDVIKRYRDYFFSITIDVSTSRSSFATSLIEKIDEVDSISSYESPSFIKLASIDVAVDSIFDILKVLGRDKRLSYFFDRILLGKNIEQALSNSDYSIADDLGFITKTHVTLAHCRNMSQSDLRCQYTPHLESTVELSTNSLLWSDRVMALAVSVSDVTSDGNAFPTSHNKFVHITVWCDQDASAMEANSLPALVELNEAHCLDFPSYSLRGTISLWDMH